MDDLAPGFRFYPTEEELVSFYLHNKLEGKREDLIRVTDRVLLVVDIYVSNPWDIPQFSGDLCYGDPEQWFFFSPRQERVFRGGRPNRLTATGYWKATGSPSYVYSSNNRIIGVKRTMVFYTGRAPTGIKTEWKMNEYKAIEGEAPSSSSSTAVPTLRHEISLCRLYKKSKCLRAFHRRPSGVVISDPAAKQVHHVEEAPRSSSPNNSLTGRKHPRGSSSSGHHGHPSQPAEIENMGMAVDDENFLDWEQFDWLNLFNLLNWGE